MGIVIFIIDTSASMNQKTYLGMSLFDVAKGAVETFIKLRARDPGSRGDRYMLVTCDDPPFTIKAGWKENLATFTSELKNLEAHSLTGLGTALSQTFALLNVNRLFSGIDNYGQGRNPFFLEPSVILLFTDGNKYTSISGLQQELLLSHNVLPGSELTREQFRWDQRVYSVLLKIPGNFNSTFDIGSNINLNTTSLDDDLQLGDLCELTGGCSFIVHSAKQLSCCLENLTQKMQSGVVVNFKKFDSADSGSSEPIGKTNSLWDCHKIIYVRPNPKTGVPIGHWPIPEAFWPDVNCPSLPPRDAHPIIYFKCVDCEPFGSDNIPFDKYELEPSELGSYILERKLPSVCWQVFVKSNGKGESTPFGYLKASSSLNCVNLIVMPYNYPVLLPLIDELVKIHKMKPIQRWRQSFESYLRSIPGYYITPLRDVLKRMGIVNIIPENVETTISYSVISYLKRLKQQSKIESDRIATQIAKHKGKMMINVTQRSSSSLDYRRNNLIETHFYPNINKFSEADNEIGPLSLSYLKDTKTRGYLNPFDTNRKYIVDQLTRMRTNFIKTITVGAAFQDEDFIHNVPITEMGNYQEYLKRAPSPLREADPLPGRVHMFGNPFKLDDKNKRMMVDEADEFVSGSNNPSRKSFQLKKMRTSLYQRDNAKNYNSIKGNIKIQENIINSQQSLIVNNISENEKNTDNRNKRGTSSDSIICLDGIEKIQTNDLENSPDKELQQFSNLQIALQITQAIRRPGRVYLMGIITELEPLKINKKSYLMVLNSLIKEAKRFKRKLLADNLENYQHSIYNNI